MAYSQQTAHYGLPLPVGSDRSSFLDTNESFTAIDTAIYNAVTQNTQTEQEVQDLNAEVAQVQSDITTIGTDIAALQNGLASTNLLVQEHAEDITALESGKQDKTDNNLVTADKTIVGAINELAGAGGVEADNVSYDNTTSGLTATNVQAAIDEVAGVGVSAANVSYDNTASGLTADDVQEAIDELSNLGTTKIITCTFEGSTSELKIPIHKHVHFCFACGTTTNKYLMIGNIETLNGSIVNHDVTETRVVGTATQTAITPTISGDNIIVSSTGSGMSNVIVQVIVSND